MNPGILTLRFPKSSITSPTTWAFGETSACGFGRRFRADVFCGLFMEDFNEGISLSHETLQKLAERGLMIDFDIYNNSDA